MVELRTHKPSVASSNLALATKRAQLFQLGSFFCFWLTKSRCTLLSPLAQRLFRHLRETSLIPAEAPCLIALSGGGDSVALTLLLHELKDVLSLRLFAAHLNHGLRPEADDDALFVQKLCQRLEIPLFSEKTDAKAFAQSRGISLEAAGRRLRYTLFAKASRQFHTALVLTAHTASDQAETVLMRLIAGTGLTGLCGIRPKRRLNHGDLVRPLLIFRGSELREYLRDKQQTWREDSTNHEPTAPRTRVRLQLLPLLEQWNPQVVGNLAHFSARVRQDERFLQRRTTQLVKGAQQNEAHTFIDLHTLNAVPASLRHRAYKRWLPHCPLESSHIYALDNLIAQAIGFSHLDLPQGYQADIVRGQLRLGQADAAEINLTAPSRPDTIIELRPGRQDIPAWGLAITLDRSPLSERPTPEKIYLNPEAIQQPLILRSRRPGDVFCPAGGAGRTKLKKYLNSLKLTSAQRDALPLLCCGETLAWVLGYRADQRFLARPHQEDVWCISWQPLAKN